MRERVGCNFTGSYVEGFFRTPGMLHRAKYSRFRNDSLTSLDDPPTTASLRVKNSSSSSPCSPLTPGSPADGLLAESGHAATALCIPKMTNLKLSNPASLLGLKGLSLGAKEIARVKGTDTFEAQSLSSSALDLTSCFSAFPHPKQELHKPAASSMQFGGGQPVSQDWAKVSPHPRGDVLGSGALYAVRYMGCVEVLQSMRSLDFNTRTQVTREAISRVCEAVPGAKGAMRRRKPPSKGLSTILGKSNLQFSGMNIIMSISTNSLNLTIPHSKQIIANHHMQSISFASGGDPDTTDYVAYVAKDPVNQRACHIVECSDDLAQDVINTIGKAFELRFKQYLKNSPVVITPNERCNERRPGLAIWNVEGDEDQNHGYYNEMAGKLAPPGSPENAKVKEDSAAYSNNSQIKKDGDFSQTASPSSVTIYENYSDPHKETFIMAEQADAATFNKTTAVPLSNTLSSMREQLAKEVWYRGRMSRQEAEKLLIKDGDFLVRESVTTPEQYVLTGLQGGQAKHLLLVDPEGLVRTKDCIFESVSHLISYHVDNQLPIISSGNQLYLKRAV
ncbi:SHC-transforming protein 1-like isoform X1 [Hemiscyllium ocellatum]|uniref:SHC-transforming protein 1-like isoform X1 n=2 Tax=Hemiscyllium ocellatum TaxID=170820 RepID=UPI0029665767|nr:SHC-transforming protein 1-like isoform X1 [Hemiscyllium ocellatum]